MNQAEALKEDIICRLCAIRIPTLRAEALSHTLGVCQSMACLPPHVIWILCCA